MRNTTALALILLLSACPAVCTAGDSRPDGWIPLFDGKSLSGWKAGGNAGSFAVREGMIVCDGPAAHLFYVGDVEDADFKDFELKAAAMTTPGADSGISFHTEYRKSGAPTKGYEAQINNSQAGPGDDRELKRTGSLCGVRNQYKSIVSDKRWFTMHIIVAGKRIRILVDGTPVVDYTEPQKPVRSGPYQQRRLSRGTFALECRGPGRKVLFKDIRVRPLPDGASVPPADRPVVDECYAQIIKLNMADFPLVDFHVHLKGGLTLEEALANARKTGINYGIAPNCGLGFPITNDEGIYKFLQQMQAKPAFLGMQAEGREWVNLFSKEAIARFDYVFTDALTFTDDKGKRTRLWIRSEVEIDDKEAFMDMYVERILAILNNEPIDVFVNATFLPASIAAEYDRLWTEQRMKKVIDAAVRNGVAIEINAGTRIPSPKFIKLAKRAGVKFTFGTNNGGRRLGRLEYCLEMIDKCGLTPKDMFMPKPKAAR